MRWLRKERFRFLRGQKGLTLIEVLVAAAILAAIGVGLLNALDTNVKATQQLDEKVVATNLATAYFEAIKAMPYYTDVETYLNDVTIQNITIPPQYIVNVDLDFSSESIKEGDITQIIWVDDYDELIDQTLQKITISVSREGGKHILTICTFKTKRVES